jgi:flagellar biosynthesis protein FliP
MARLILALACAGLFLMSDAALAQNATGAGLERAVSVVSGEGRSLSLSLQLLLLMSLLTVLPSLILMMTSFTRIIIVLSILRQALGLQQTPPNQVLVGLSLFLSLFIMQPVLSDINRTAIQPYGQNQISIEEAITHSGTSLHGFMMKQTRKSDLQHMMCLSRSCCLHLSPANSKLRSRSAFSFSCRS